MLKAYAKVNLSLKIVNILPNNYHLLEAINVKIALADLIDITKAESTEVTYQYFRIDKEEDTLLKVLNAFLKKYNLPPQKVHIIKKIPVASGLGGLSSDIACIIKYLNKKYKLKLTNKELTKFVLPFGTDICYCLYDKPALVKGIGESVQLIKIKLPKRIILVDPKIKVSTKEIYEAVTDVHKESYSRVLLETLGKDDLISIYMNDLECVTFKKYPALFKLYQELVNLKVGKVQMSGSGSSLVIYSESKEVLQMLQQKYPEYHIESYKILK